MACGMWCAAPCQGAQTSFGKTQEAGQRVASAEDTGDPLVLSEAPFLDLIFFFFILDIALISNT